MITTILSELERKRMRTFIKADGEKLSGVRGLATRCHQRRQQIVEDLALIDEFLKHYKNEKA